MNSHWGVCRHDGEYSVVKYVNTKALADAALSKQMLAWLNQASHDKEIKLQQACTQC